MEWETGKLSDLVVFQRGFDITKARQVEGKVPIISSSGITSFHNVAKQIGPAIIIGRKGTLGSVHFYSGEYWPHDTTLWSKEIKGDPRFVYYLLQTMKLEQYDVGNANPTLNRNHIHRLDVPIPPPTIQQKIAHILSAYDDLIENNLKRIKLLEEMAQITYEQWFIRMKFPGHETTPIDAETGLPEGWSHLSVGSLLQHEIGGGWGKEELSQEFSESAYVIRGTDFDGLSTGELSNVPYRYHKKSNLASRKLKHGDIIFEVSGGSHYAGVARNAFVDGELLEQLNDSVMCASFCKLVRADELRNAYLLYHFFKFLRSIKATEVFEIRSASNIVNYNWTAFLKFQQIPFPADVISNEFQELVAPIHKQLYQLGKQNQLLKEARDILLPRLMTGMINVDKIELPTPKQDTEAA